MNKPQTILLVDDDPSVTEALSLMLEQPGRTTIICSDVQAAEILLARYPVTHLVTDVQFSGEFGFEGLHFLSRARSVAPQCHIVLMTGHVTDALERTAKSFGASEVLAKPFGLDEIERALGAYQASGDGTSYEVIRFPSLEEILAGDELTTAFQPILRVTSDGVETHAYEALTRVRGQWLPGGPEMLFDYAERRHQLVELNLVTINNAFDAAVSLPGKPLLFLNADPAVFTDASLIPTLTAASQRSGIPLSRVVLEVTERCGFSDRERAGQAFDELRKLGLRFALDDHASAYSHFALINRIAPAFLKISNTFGTDFELDPTRSLIVRNIIALGHDLGCKTILEGIEGAATTSAAVALGVDLMQGFHFGRPACASHWFQSMANAA